MSDIDSDRAHEAYVRNLLQSRKYLQNVYTLMDATNRRFAFKQPSVELSRAVARFIDYELSVEAGEPKPEFLRAAQVLLNAACRRLNITTQEASEPAEIVIYHVEVRLTRRNKRKFVYLPKGLDCKEYVEARESGSPEYLSAEVLGIVSSEEEKERIRTSNQFVRTGSERSQDEQWLYNKIQQTGLLKAIESIFELSSHLRRNRPKDTLRYIVTTARVAGPMNEMRDPLVARKLKREIGCPVDAKFTAWQGNGIAFVVVNECIIAVTLVETLGRYDTWRERLMVLDPPGMPWIPLRMITD